MFNRLRFSPDMTKEDPENAGNYLSSLHPVQLTALLEVFWELRAHNLASPGSGITTDLGSPFYRSDLPGLDKLRAQIPTNLAQIPTHPVLEEKRILLWDHLIYAYMIENTRIYDIFRRVLHEFLHGEKLGVPILKAQDWLRNTEALYYAAPMPMSISAIETHIRPDMGASRRNAYYRMFGMDLNHGSKDNQPYQYVRAQAANYDFVSTFENLLSEVWIGQANWRNLVGQNPTDKGKIEELVDRLHDMLISRREYGNLSREEFVFVSMMSWFHLTVLYDSPIVVTLRAEAGSPEQRLFKIAERVGLPAHGLSRSYFEIAEPISRILILIETDALKNHVEVLYKESSTPPNRAFNDMNKIITHWSIISGRDVKARKVAPS